MRFSFLSWNIKHKDLNKYPLLRPEYLARMQAPFSGVGNNNVFDVVALQEVHRSQFEFLKASGLFAWYKYSLDEEDVRGDWGCALLGSSKFTFERAYILNFGGEEETRRLFANQAYVVELSSPQAKTLTVGSFHVPNGSRHGFRKGDFKRRFGHSIAEWLEKSTSPTIFGIDANSPDVDHIDPSQVRLFKSDSEKLFGRTRIHNFRDVYCALLSAQPAQDSAISFHGTRNFPARFDHIWGNEGIGVHQVKYGELTMGAKSMMLHTGNGEILSDHAWVAASLSLLD